MKNCPICGEALNKSDVFSFGYRFECSKACYTIHYNNKHIITKENFSIVYELNLFNRCYMFVNEEKSHTKVTIIDANGKGLRFIDMNIPTISFIDNSNIDINAVIKKLNKLMLIV